MLYIKYTEVKSPILKHHFTACQRQPMVIWHHMILCMSLILTVPSELLNPLPFSHQTNPGFGRICLIGTKMACNERNNLTIRPHRSNQLSCCKLRRTNLSKLPICIAHERQPETTFFHMGSYVFCKAS